MHANLDANDRAGKRAPVECHSRSGLKDGLTKGPAAASRRLPRERRGGPYGSEKDLIWFARAGSGKRVAVVRPHRFIILRMRMIFSPNTRNLADRALAAQLTAIHFPSPVRQAVLRTVSSCPPIVTVWE